MPPGLGVGLFLGYRVGFMARPVGYRDPSYTYEKEHRRQQYNKREDGRIECSVGDTTSYIKVNL